MLQRQYKEMQKEKEYFQGTVGHRQKYGYLSDPQYYTYTGLRQIGVPREEALFQVQNNPISESEAKIERAQMRQFERVKQEQLLNY